jgi:hypothetical protein
VNVDCTLLHLYGIIGLHLRVIMRKRNEGEIETNLLDSTLFLGGSISGTLEIYAMVGQFMSQCIPKVHE